MQFDGLSTDVSDADAAIVFSDGGMSIRPGLNYHGFSVVFGKDNRSVKVTDVAPVAGVGTDDPSLLAIERFADGLRVGRTFSVERTRQGVLTMTGSSLRVTALRN